MALYTYMHVNIYCYNKYSKSGNIAGADVQKLCTLTQTTVHALHCPKISYIVYTISCIDTKFITVLITLTTTLKYNNFTHQTEL